MRANLASRFRTMDPALVCRMLRKPPWVFLEKVAWISRTQSGLARMPCLHFVRALQRRNVRPDATNRSFICALFRKFK